MIANKECYERGCACHDSRVDGDGIEVEAKREWVGLTDEEREEIALEVPMDAIRITEAKLKEKNT